MELDNLGDGQKWEFPKCLKCKFSDGNFCKKYKDDKTDLPIDLFACPGFEPNEEVNEEKNVD